jgi:hypothetical protein
MVWSAPLQLCLALAMLWNALGQPVLGGAAVMLLLWPVQVRVPLLRMLAIDEDERLYSPLIATHQHALPPKTTHDYSLHAGEPLTRPFGATDVHSKGY